MSSEIVSFTPLVKSLCKAIVEGDESARPALHDALVEIGFRNEWILRSLLGTYPSSNDYTSGFCALVRDGSWTRFETSIPYCMLP